MNLKQSLRILALLLFTLGVSKAANFDIDKPVTFSASGQSQTLSIGLDEIPSALVKKNGEVKNATIKAKLRLRKKDKKNFTLSPKNGLIKIKVRDGAVSPGEITITSKTGENGDYFYTLLPNRMASKKLKLKKISKLISIGDMVVITGRFIPPEADETKFLTKKRDLEGVQIELRQMGLSTAGDPIEVIGTGNTDPDGFFEIPMPLDDFELLRGPGLLCQTTSGELELRTFVTDLQPVLDPPSEFLVQRINDDHFGQDISNWAGLDLIQDLDIFIRGFEPSATSLEAILLELSDNRKTGCTVHISSVKNGADTSIPLFDTRVFNTVGFTIGPAINFAGQNGTSPIILPTSSIAAHEGLIKLNPNTNTLFSAETESFRTIDMRLIQAPPSLASNASVFFTHLDLVNNPPIFAQGITFHGAGGPSFQSFVPPNVSTSDGLRVSTAGANWNLFYNNGADSMVGVQNFTKITDTDAEGIESFGAIIATGLTYFTTFAPNPNDVLPGRAFIYGLDFIHSENGKYGIGAPSGVCDIGKTGSMLCNGEYLLVENNLYGGALNSITLPILSNATVTSNKQGAKIQSTDKGINLDDFFFADEYHGILANGTVFDLIGSQSDDSDSILSSRVLIDSHVDPLSDPLVFGFIWVTDGFTADGRLVDYKYADLEFKLIDTSNFQVDFGPIIGESILLPFDPLLGDLDTLLPSPIGPLDPLGGTSLPIPPDPSLMGFELATQGLTIPVQENFSCTISSNKQTIACKVTKDSSGTKSVGIGIGVRK